MKPPVFVRHYVPLSQISEMRRKMQSRYPSLTRDEVISRVVPYTPLCQTCGKTNDNREVSNCCSVCYLVRKEIDTKYTSSRSLTRKEARERRIHEGKCIQCGADETLGRKMCPTCIAKSNASKKFKSERKVRDSMVPGFSEIVAETYAERQRIYFRLRYRWLKSIAEENRRCITCGAEMADPRYRSCRTCRTRDGERRQTPEYRNQVNARNAERRAKFSREGKCIQCGAERDVPDRKSCGACLRYFREQKGKY